MICMILHDHFSCVCVWNYYNTKRSIYSKLIFEFPYQCLDSNLNLNWWYQEYPDDHPWHLFQLSLIFWASFAKQFSWKSFILLIKTAHILLLFNWIWEGQECHDDHPWHLFQYCILFWESFVKQVFWKSFILLIKTALSSCSVIGSVEDRSVLMTIHDIYFNNVCYFEQVL